MISSGKVAVSKMQGALGELEHMMAMLNEISRASFMLPAAGQTSISAFFSSARAPPTADNPSLKPVAPISLPLLREVYLRDFRLYASPLLRRLWAVSGSIWRVDHSFKFAKVYIYLC